MVQNRKKVTQGARLTVLAFVILFTLVNAACTGLTGGSSSQPGNGSLSVSLSSPASGTNVSGTVMLAAIATDNTTVSSIQFQIDGANSGAPVTTAPFSAAWNTAKSTNGKHLLTAVATDSTGSHATSSGVQVTVNNSSSDTTPPTVSITSPSANATVSGTISVTANASDNVGVASVQFDVDGAAFGVADTSSPYSQSLDTTKLANGKHTLTAIATDDSNNKATSAGVSITVSNKTADTTPPTVSITSPASGASVSGTITVTANASDNVAVASVQFEVDGVASGAADTTAPYSISLDTTKLSNGSHSLRAVATDTSNNKATSASVSVTVSNKSSDTTPPSVSITSPASGASVSGSISVTANASDNVAVASVQFLVDGATFGSLDTTSPYSQTLDTTKLSNGAHTLTAVAADTSNNKATSAGVSINVNNQASNPLTVSITSPATGATVSGTIVITATASASAGVANVQFQIDGVNQGAPDTASPFTEQWNTTTVVNGSHTIKALATAIGGVQATATSTVNVNNSTGTPGAGWTKISFSELSGSENTSPCPSNTFNNYTPNDGPFQSNCMSVILAWSSAMADPARNRVIIWGGGHDDGNNNEVYSLELGQVGSCSASAPCLVRLDPPSPPNTVNAFDVETLPAATALPAQESNGAFFGCAGGCGPFSLPTTPAPNSRHTYDGLVFAPQQNAMFSFGGALNSNGNPSSAIWKLDLTSVTASCAPNCDPKWTQATSTNDIGSVGNTTDYDPNTGLIWVANQNILGNFNPATGVYKRQAFTSTTYLATGIIDPVHEYFLYIGGTNAVPGQPTGVTYWSIASGSSFTQNQPQLNAACNATNWGTYPGLAWDPIDKVVVIYPNKGNVLYLLDPATWTCTAETHGSTMGVDYPQNSNSSMSGNDYTFKHFLYMSNTDTYVLCNDWQHDCWALHRH